MEKNQNIGTKSAFTPIYYYFHFPILGGLFQALFKLLGESNKNQSVFA